MSDRGREAICWILGIVITAVAATFMGCVVTTRPTPPHIRTDRKWQVDTPTPTPLPSATPSPSPTPRGPTPPKPPTHTKAPTATPTVPHVSVKLPTMPKRLTPTPTMAAAPKVAMPERKHEEAGPTKPPAPSLPLPAITRVVVAGYRSAAPPPPALPALPPPPPRKKIYSSASEGGGIGTGAELPGGPAPGPRSKLEGCFHIPANGLAWAEERIRAGASATGMTPGRYRIDAEYCIDDAGNARPDMVHCLPRGSGAQASPAALRALEREISTWKFSKEKTCDSDKPCGPMGGTIQISLVVSL